MRISLLPLASCLLLAASCANPINLRNAEKYYSAALQASQRGEHEHAAMLHSRAYGNAKMGGAPDAGLAMTMYGYGRELALLGEFEEAESLLTASLELQREVEPFEPLEVIRRASVLGRIYLDTGRPKLAIPMFHEVIGHADGLPEGDISPADMMYVMKDLVAAAQAAGDGADLRGADSRLAALLAEHGDVEPGFPYERFTPSATAARRAADPGRAPVVAE